MPQKSTLRSAMARLLFGCDGVRGAEGAVDRDGGPLAVLDGDDGEIAAAGHAISACPDAGERRAALVVDHDAPLGERGTVAGRRELAVAKGLTDRREELVG